MCDFCCTQCLSACLSCCVKVNRLRQDLKWAKDQLQLLTSRLSTNVSVHGVCTGITTTSAVDLGDEAIWGRGGHTPSCSTSLYLPSSPPFPRFSLSPRFLSFSYRFPASPLCFLLLPPVLLIPSFSFYLSATPLVQGVGSAVSSQAGFGVEPWPPTHF